MIKDILRRDNWVSIIHGYDTVLYVQVDKLLDNRFVAVKWMPLSVQIGKLSYEFEQEKFVSEAKFLVELNPIEIDSVLLRKIDFAWSADGYFIYQDIQLYPTEQHTWKMRLTSCEAIHPIEIFYIHQLQNNFYGITGKECILRLQNA